MAVFNMWLKPELKDRIKLDFVPFECEFDTLRELGEALDAGGMVYGSTLWTRRDPDDHGVRFVYRRTEMLISQAMLLRVEVPKTRFVEEID